jgi:carbamate kinase
MPQFSFEPHFAVVAIGGNAIILENQEGNIPEQFANCEEFLFPVAVLVSKGWKIALTHGNGPQVGSALLRVELSRKQVYPLPLDICVADTQGGMGYMLQNVLGKLLRRLGVNRDVVSVVTQVEVEATDPAFQNPTKPIGPFYTQEQIKVYQEKEGWAVGQDAKGRWRRLVPSPKPKEILETHVIRRLVNDGTLVIACGGGGVPVVAEKDGYRGVEAVVDKDLASSLLAQRIGAEMLIITTGEDQVALHYKKPDQKFLDHLTVAEAEKYLAEGEFPPGSMGPKIVASIEFLKAGGKEALITTPERLLEALEGKTGTRITL